MTDSSESDNEDLTSKAKKKPAVIEDDDDDDHEGMIFQVFFFLKLVSYYYTHWSYYTRKFPLFFKYTYNTIAKYIFGKN
jgi:hypothetical protein